MRFKIFGIIFSFFILFLNIIMFIQCYNLGTDSTKYKNINNRVVVSYSDLFKSGLQIGDTVMYVNNNKIKDRFFLSNQIIDKIGAGNQVSYTVKKNNQFINYTAKLTHRYKTSLLISNMICSVLFILLSTILYFLSSKTIMHKLTWIFYIIYSNLLFSLHVPYGQWYLYIFLIIFASLLHIILILMSFYFVKNNFNKSIFTILFTINASVFIFWMSSYINWIIHPNDVTHIIATRGTRAFHIGSLIAIIFVIVNTFRKLFIFIQSENSKFIFYSSVFFSVLLLFFPILYSIPVAVKFRELIAFEYYFYLFLIPLFLTIYNQLFRKKN